MNAINPFPSPDPLLINIFYCLSLVNIGTPRETNLSALLRISHITQRSSPNPPPPKISFLFGGGQSRKFRRSNYRRQRRNVDRRGAKEPRSHILRKRNPSIYSVIPLSASHR